MYFLKSRSLYFKLANIWDASFIHSLRINDDLAKYLSPVDTNLNTQKEWLEKYKVREENGEELYYIIYSNLGAPIGTVRIYDIKTKITWGSWVLTKHDGRSISAIESALAVYDIIFKNLKKEKCDFKVDINNKGVCGIHNKLGATFLECKDNENFYSYNLDNFNAAKEKYKKYYKQLINL